jgi:hypothetical protein
MVERRDQVLITGGRWPPARVRSTAFRMLPSMNGPFLTDRAMLSPIFDLRFLIERQSLPSDHKSKIKNPKSQIT